MSQLAFYLAMGVLVTLLNGISLAVGYHKGATEIRSQWETERALTQQAQANIEAAYERLAQDHAEQSLMVEQELKNERIKHKKAIAAIRNDYDSRLREQDKRIAGYAQIAASGDSGCRAVAGRAAELDRTLGEGIDLVKELTAVVGYRDSTIRMMDRQLQANQGLLEGLAR